MLSHDNKVRNEVAWELLWMEKYSLPPGLIKRPRASLRHDDPAKRINLSLIPLPNASFHSIDRQRLTRVYRTEIMLPCVPIYAKKLVPSRRYSRTVRNVNEFSIYIWFGDNRFENLCWCFILFRLESRSCEWEILRPLLGYRRFFASSGSLDCAASSRSNDKSRYFHI